MLFIFGFALLFVFKLTLLLVLGLAFLLILSFTFVLVLGGTLLVLCTGKFLSEALILSSINPQYDKRLFTDLPVQYMKTTSSEHGENMMCA